VFTATQSGSLRAGETESASVQTNSRKSIRNLMSNTPFDHPCLRPFTTIVTDPIPPTVYFTP